MANNPQFYIVEASALPEVFLKVAEAKRLLSTGEASTVNEATKMMDISRSAFYKYRDSVLPFQNMMTGRIITFQFLLHDRKGLLSELLGIFAEHKANIHTINSIMPQGGSALVVEGDVARGIVFAIAPANNSATDNDEDDDGIEDAKEGARAFAEKRAPVWQGK